MRSDQSTAQPKFQSMHWPIKHVLLGVPMPLQCYQIYLSHVSEFLHAVCSFVESGFQSPPQEVTNPSPPCTAVCDRTRRLHTFLQPGRGTHSGGGTSCKKILEETPAPVGTKSAQIQAVSPWHGQTAPRATSFCHTWALKHSPHTNRMFFRPDS